MEGQEVPKIREQQQRERLSDAQMGNLISALGNHEAKAAVLCLMTPGIIYSAGDLHRAIIWAQGQNIGWRMSRSDSFSYCQNSLSPIGLVTHEAINPDLSAYGYMKTEYGDKVGVPLAGLLLDFSLRHPSFSLWDFFGGTASSSQSQEIGEMEYKKRSPTTRLKIFCEILTSSLPIRCIDIARQTGEITRTIGTHLSNLSENGLLSYEAIKPGEARVFYRLSETPPSSEPEPLRRLVSLTNFVYELLKKDGNKEWFAEAVQEQHRQYQKINGKPLRKEAISTDIISDVLSHLVKKGYARRRKFIGGKIHSEVTLTEEQRKMLLELVTLLDRFQNQDPAVLKLGKRLASGIIANPEKVSLLLAKAKERSSHAGALPTQETAGDILRIISSSPGYTANQIHDTLKEEGRRLSQESIVGIIRVLLAGRKITQTTIRGVRHFNLVDKT